MTDKPIDLDQRRGMAAQKATDERRTSSAGEADQEALRRGRVEIVADDGPTGARLATDVANLSGEGGQLLTCPKQHRPNVSTCVHDNFGGVALGRGAHGNATTFQLALVRDDRRVLDSIELNEPSERLPGCVCFLLHFDNPRGALLIGSTSAAARNTCGANA